MDAKKFNNLIGQIDDRKAFEELYITFFPLIVAHIYFKFRKHDMCEDVAHEFFTKIFKEKIEEYIENPLGWIYTVCDRIACDFLRDEKRYLLAYREAENDSDELFERILYGSYFEAVKALDDETRDIIEKFYFEGYSHKEIAEITGISYGVVRQKCSRGLKKIKKIEKNKIIV